MLKVAPEPTETKSVESGRKTIQYCARCMYPSNAKPTIIFDDQGVCSGCRYHESRSQLEISWEDRQKMLEQILDDAKKVARQRGNAHDCIVPVSGGKDSQFQVWLLKEKYDMHPLLVTYNHAFNCPSGVRNLETLVEQSGFDLVRYTAGVDSVRKLSRYMLETVGDVTWHYHAGIRTLPFQVAVNYNIPLIVWGEHGFAELTGLVTLDDLVEFTKWTRKEHDMRGYEPHDLVGKGGITEHDIAPYIYPTDDQIAQTGVRGIYLSNFFFWSAKNHAELMIEKWGFKPIAFERDRTFNLHSKIDDHANDVHDYLKYLKFGYGRGTDDASMEVRHGRMTREEAVEAVRRYDAREPRSLEMYCDFFGITTAEFYKLVEPMRDKNAWQAHSDGSWQARTSVVDRPIGPREEAARVPQVEDRTFAHQNRHLYFNPNDPPPKTGDPAFDEPAIRFKIL